MIIKANTNFNGVLDISAMDTLQEVNDTEKDYFRIGIRPGQIIEVDDKWYSLRNIQTAVSAGYIEIFGYKGEVKGFLNLNDAPSDYTGEAGKVVAVNPTETGLLFVDSSGITPTDKFKVSAIDTTSGYASDKIVQGTGITITTLNVGGNELLGISLYVSPSVSLSGGSTNEKGSTVANVNLSWTTNKTMTSRLLSSPVPVGDRDQGAGGSGSYSHTGANLISNTTYSLTVGDETSTSTSSTSVSFLNRRFYGVSASDTIDNSGVLALLYEFCYSRSNTHTYNCSGGKYIWICYPASFGSATFTVGGLETTFSLFTQAVTNVSGYTESYFCHRSTEIQNGTDITAVVT